MRRPAKRLAKRLAKGLAALGLAAALGGAPAAAQVEIPPGEAQFRMCRVALLFHLETESWSKARYPRAVAETLLEQMYFVMSEYVFGHPSNAVRTSVDRVRYAERFFFDNSALIREHGEKFRDLETRERVLDDCVPFVWTAVRHEIDQLLHARKGLMGLPEPLPHRPLPAVE
ncbi:hypothetical protein LNKW23_38270 [Paralimibaculum aggregatum]|uniref:Uncharacterized protein n=1 Tax=Paralimibaculum aggregatum TaxID=3036245 RepID=A0ABQ6LPT2_9RHOB|nr:hypothetical protein [Limibaculum sp. NKW23]GMG84611.1 hypothetical protein LNKW23_38270 [Limibaculum sp. NKW23]